MKQPKDNKGDVLLIPIQIQSTPNDRLNLNHIKSVLHLTTDEDAVRESVCLMRLALSEMAANIHSISELMNMSRKIGRDG